MSSKLFAFKVSKKIEKVDEKAHDQWVGDQTARAFSWCSNFTSYGNATCSSEEFGYCNTDGGIGSYLCDGY